MSTQTLTVKIPKQMVLNPLASFTLSLGHAFESTVKNLMLASFVLNLIFPALLKALFDAIRGLQLILHLPIFNVIVPGNVARIYAILIPICMYDVTSEIFSDLFKKWFPQMSLEDFKNSLTLDQLSDLGYDTYNPIINLGTLSFLLLMYLIKAVVTFLLLKPITIKTGRFLTIYERFVS